MMRILSSEERSQCKCAKCGEHRSVKYSIDGRTYCNKCALEAIRSPKQELIEDLQLEQTEQM